MVTAGYIALFVPSLILATVFALAFPAYWAENIGAMASLGLGRSLSSGRRWNVFGLLVTAWLFSSLFYFALRFLPGLTFLSESRTWLIVTEAFAHGLATSVAGPVLPAMLIVAYYDSRVRKEGFDVELAIRRLGGPSETPT